MPRMKRVEPTVATGFVGRMRELGHNYPHFADQLERDGTLNILGYTLWRRFGDEYRDHNRHYRCTVDTEGRIVGACSTQDPRLLLQAED